MTLNQNNIWAINLESRWNERYYFKLTTDLFSRYISLILTIFPNMLFLK